MPPKFSLTRKFKLPEIALGIKPSKTPKPLSALVALARAHARLQYSPSTELHYHNWGHVEAFEKDLVELIGICRKAGIKDIDEDGLRIAAYIHDMHNQVKAPYFGFKSQEEYAGHYGFNFVLENGGSLEDAKRVARYIHATHWQYEPRGRPWSTEEILMRAADLRNIGGSYEGFSENFVRMHNESMSISGTQFPEQEFARRSFSFLPLFIWRFLTLTPKAYNQFGASAFHTNALSNIFRKWVEVHGGRGGVRLVMQVGAGRRPILMHSQLPDSHFYIGVEPDPQNSRRGLKTARAVLQAKGSRVPAFFVPGSGSSLPIPEDQSIKVDELHYSDVNHNKVVDFKEINRVLSRVGKVIVQETRGASRETRGRPSAQQVKNRFKSMGFYFDSEASQEGKGGRYKLVFQPSI